MLSAVKEKEAVNDRRLSAALIIHTLATGQAADRLREYTFQIF